MKGLRLLVMGVVVFGCCSLYGQAKLGMQINAFPTQIDLGVNSSPISADLKIINYSDKSFNGAVGLNYTLNDTFYTGEGGGLLSFSTITLSIPPNDTLLTSVIIYPNQPAFQTIGTSVVVIWPFSLSALTHDSTSYTVQSTITTAGLSKLANEKVKLFVSQQQLFIYTTAENYLKHLRVYNLQGQLLIDQSLSSSTVLNINKYSTACYLVELTFIDNSQKVYKVVDNGTR